MYLYAISNVWLWGLIASTLGAGLFVLWAPRTEFVHRVEETMFDVVYNKAVYVLISLAIVYMVLSLIPSAFAALVLAFRYVG